MGAAGCDAAGKLKNSNGGFDELIQGDVHASTRVCRQTLLQEEAAKKQALSEDCSEPGGRRCAAGGNSFIQPSDLQKKVEAADIALESGHCSASGALKRNLRIRILSYAQGILFVTLCLEGEVEHTVFMQDMGFYKGKNQ